MSEAGGFLSRWSRKKAGIGEVPAAEEIEVPAVTATNATPACAGALPATATATAEPGLEPQSESLPLPTMADVASLTRQSDYARFVLPGVEPGVKNAALKKLFADPHFNIMDGLDTYIDDYGKPDPIPLSMLRSMNQSAVLGLFDHEAADPDLPPAAAASPDGDATLAVAQSAGAAPEPLPAAASHAVAPTEPDDDPDLRLQPNDAARRPGTEPGTGGPTLA